MDRESHLRRQMNCTIAKKEKIVSEAQRFLNVLLSVVQMLNKVGVCIDTGSFYRDKI